MTDRPAAARSAPTTGASTRRRTVVLGSLTSFLVGLDALVVATALPTLHQQYGGGVAVLGWTVDAYQLAFAASILTGAMLGDRFGRRRVFVVGVVVFSLASGLCALSPSIEALIAARTLQGIGGGLAVPLALALITDATPPQERGRILGIWGAITGVAVATGPLVGGAVVEGLAWQWIFWLNVPVGLAIAAASRTITEHAPRLERRPDWIGLVLSTAAVYTLAQALIRAEANGWTSPTVAGGLAAGLALAALFLFAEHRAADPMMPLAMFRSRTFSIGCLTSFTLMAGVFGFGFLTAQYLQLALGNSPFDVGIRLLPATGLALALSPIAGRIADRTGEPPLVLLGLTLLGVGLVLIGSLVTDTSGYEMIVGPLVVVGAGIAIAFPTVATAVLREITPAKTSVASGVSNTFRQVGAVFGVAIAASVFGANGSYRTPHDFVAGYRPAFLVLGLLCVIGAATTIPLLYRDARR